MIVQKNWEGYEDCYSKGEPLYTDYGGRLVFEHEYMPNDTQLYDHIKKKLESFKLLPMYGHYPTNKTFESEANLYLHLWDFMRRNWYGLVIAKLREPPNPAVDKLITRYIEVWNYAVVRSIKIQEEDRIRRMKDKANPFIKDDKMAKI